MALIKVTDWSKWQGRVGRERIARMVDDGVRGVVIGSWHGLDANPNAEADLRDARQLGLATSTYIVVNNRAGAETVRRGRDACGAEWEHLSSVWIDVEVPGVTEAILQDALDAAYQPGAPPGVGIYTGRWFWNWWQLSVGHAIRQFARYPLWTALYDGRADLRFDPYGGWTECIGKQYAGSTQAYGTTVDFSAFDREWFEAGTAPTPEPAVVHPVPPKEDEMSSKEAEALRAWVKTAVHDPIVGRLAALERHVAALHGGQPAPAPTPGRTYTVVSGDNASAIANAHGLSLAQLVAKNPGKPRSGDWALIYPGEVFNV